MANRTVFKKTAKGTRESGARTSSLQPSLAKLLDLVDGKLTVDELKAKIGRVEDAKLAAALEHLKKEGYIEPLAAAAPPPAPAPDEPITLDFTIVAKPSAPSPAPKPPAAPASKPAPPPAGTKRPAQPAGAKPPARPAGEKPPPPQPAAPKPQPAADEPSLDLGRDMDLEVPKPSKAQIAEAEQLTLAGMRTLKEAGYYVNILSKPGINHPPRSGKKYSVLLLDHDKQGALLTARALMLADFDVRNAENREQALAEMKKVPLPDAIVLNLQIPELNAMNLLARLAQHEYYASVPIVVITDDHAHETVVDALARGAAGYMTKPFKESALLDNVRAVLGLR